MSAALIAPRAPTSRRLPTWQRALRPLVEPPVFDYWARALGTTLAWERTLARVVARRAESRQAVSLVLKPNHHFAGFRPGQHLNLTVTIDGVRHTRSYSPTSIPAADGLVHLTIQRVAGGRVSRELCDRTRVGAVVELGAAFGDLHLPAVLPERRLFMAAGSGITPLMSLTRALAARGAPGHTTLLYWARQREDLCFVPELRELVARSPGLRVRFLLTRQLPLGADESAGRLSAAQLARYVPDLAQRAVYACGPAGFVAHARELAAPLATSFQAEAFTPTPAVADAEAGHARVELRASGRVLELPRGQSLLTALEDAGLRPLSGCRMGICHTCVCPKLSGTSRNLQNGEHQADPEQALRLCVSAPAGDLVLDL